MDDYHYMGMEHFDGGDDRWDFDHDGKLDLFERNSRMAYDDMILGDMEDDDTDSFDDDEDEDDFDDIDEDEDEDEDPDGFDEDEFSDDDDGFGDDDEF
ncbi:MAG: hypothetical protein VZQ80_06725 [Lachnospiraceae bacterium]|nr:hypothetical protein [Lachnospiraceae bacterium]